MEKQTSEHTNTVATGSGQRGRRNECYSTLNALRKYERHIEKPVEVDPNL